MNYLDFYMEITNVIKSGGYDWDQEVTIASLNDIQDILDEARDDAVGGNDGK